MDAQSDAMERNVFSCMGSFEGVQPISAAGGEEDRTVSIEKDSAPCSYSISRTCCNIGT